MRYPLLLLVTFLPLATVQADIYKCVGEGGHVTYSNVLAKRCSRVVRTGPAEASSGEAASASPDSSANPVAPGRPPAATNAKSGTPGFPKVDPATQRVRDDDRRRILDNEMAAEQRSLDEARKALAGQESTRPANEVQGLKDKVALHERNVEALRKEIANLR
jgi:hypothetical protein